MSSEFGIHKSQLIEENITLSQIVAMWDAVRGR